MDAGRTDALLETRPTLTGRRAKDDRAIPRADWKRVALIIVGSEDASSGWTQMELMMWFAKTASLLSFVPSLVKLVRSRQVP